MLKDFIQYIVDELAPAEVKEICFKDNCEMFSDKQLYRLEPNIPMCGKEIVMHTLTSLVDYIKGDIDAMPDKMIVDVVSPTEVQLYSALNPKRDREHLVTVKARVPEFAFNHFIDNEEFIIALQSKFIDTEPRDIVLKYAGAVETGTIADYGDDGVTQKVTIRKGITSKEDALVPNPVHLKPYRTFLEVDQPASDFVFRMRDNNGTQCAIFESDGGAWIMEATSSIKAYLQEQLKEYPKFIVIS